MSAPWLSVIIPTCNGADYLARTLASVANQDTSSIEVIAIDDGSTDQTVAILESFKQQLPLRLILQSRTGNWVANSALAVQEAQGTYLCFLHQDDLWYSQRLERLQFYLSRSPDTVLWLHPCWYVDKDDGRLGRWSCPLPALAHLGCELVLGQLLMQNFIGMPAPVFKRASYAAVGGLDEHLWYAADWDLWLKLATIGRTVYLPDYLAAFRLHPQSQTIQRGRNLLELRRQCQLVFDRHLPQFRTDSPHLQRQLRRSFTASLVVNENLMAFVQKLPVDYYQLVRALWDLGPSHFLRWLRSTRLLERIAARCRCQLRP